MLPSIGAFPLSASLSGSSAALLDRLQLEPGRACRERRDKRLEPIAVKPSALSSSRYGSRAATLDIRLIKAVL